MFKIPKWEGDTPINNLNFMKSDIISKKKGNHNLSETTNKKYEIHTSNNNTINGNLVINGKLKKVKANDDKKVAKKHKLNDNIENVKKKKSSETVNVDFYDIDKPDELLINAEKKKIHDKLQNEDIEELLFSYQEANKKQNKKKKKELKINKNNNISNGIQRKKFDHKKAQLKTLLKKTTHRNHISVDGNKLRDRMLNRLKAAQFRYLNEKLYTSSGVEAQKLFQTDPNAFKTYHQGYQQQVKKWPVNPLDVIVTKITKMPKSHLIADMGCGEGALSKRVPQTVRSFDLVASPGVEACDMAHTPLLAASMDVTVYCLALMGTDLTQYLLEANRVLKNGGHLLIAEVESRFDNVDAFTKDVQKLGFKLKDLDKSHQVFFFMDFIKVQDSPAKKSKQPTLTLKPCLYKKR